MREVENFSPTPYPIPTIYPQYTYPIPILKK